MHHLQLCKTFSVTLLLLLAFVSKVTSLTHEPFEGGALWKRVDVELDDVRHFDQHVKFYVAMNYANKGDMEAEFHRVSNPRDSSYGKHLSVTELRQKYLREEDIDFVSSYFKSTPSSRVEGHEIGSMI